jgi:hypothetical protein
MATVVARKNLTSIRTKKWHDVLPNINLIIMPITIRRTIPAIRISLIHNNRALIIITNASHQGTNPAFALINLHTSSLLGIILFILASVTIIRSITACLYRLLLADSIRFLSRR